MMLWTWGCLWRFTAPGCSLSWVESSRVACFGELQSFLGAQKFFIPGAGTFWLRLWIMEHSWKTFNVGPRLGVGGFQVVSFSGGIELTWRALISWGIAYEERPLLGPWSIANSSVSFLFQRYHKFFSPLGTLLFKVVVVSWGSTCTWRSERVRWLKCYHVVFGRPMYTWNRWACYSH